MLNRALNGLHHFRKTTCPTAPKRYYKKTLEITSSLNDKSGEGRALGNLGNAYTAIGDYAEAITYHERRLQLAVAAKDLAARARACGNLGNAYSALGANDSSCFTQALKYYQQSLAVAKDSNNVPGQGQVSATSPAHMHPYCQLTISCCVS